MECAEPLLFNVQNTRGAAAERGGDIRDSVSHGGLTHGVRVPHVQQVGCMSVCVCVGGGGEEGW